MLLFPSVWAVGLEWFTSAYGLVAAGRLYVFDVSCPLISCANNSIKQKTVFILRKMGLK